MSGRIAYCVIQSNDLVAEEDLNVNGLVCERHRAESIVKRVCILRLGLTTVGHTGSHTLGEIRPLAGLEQSCSVKSGR